MIDPYDLVTRSAYVRVYSAALGCEDQVMAEGRVVWYHDGSMLGIEGADGHQGAWDARLRIEEIQDPPKRPECTCQLIDVSTYAGPAFKRGDSAGCQVHGRDRDAAIAEAQRQAREAP